MPLLSGAAQTAFLSCPPLQTVNLATASVGVIHSIATLGPAHRRVVTVEVLAHGVQLANDLDVPLPLVSDMLLTVTAALAPRDATADTLHAINGDVALSAAIVLAPAAEPQTLPLHDLASSRRRSAHLAQHEPANRVSMLDRAK